VHIADTAGESLLGVARLDLVPVGDEPGEQVGKIGGGERRGGVSGGHEGSFRGKR